MLFEITQTCKAYFIKAAQKAKNKLQELKSFSFYGRFKQCKSNIYLHTKLEHSFYIILT